MGAAEGKGIFKRRDGAVPEQKLWLTVVRRAVAEADGRVVLDAEEWQRSDAEKAAIRAGRKAAARRWLCVASEDLLRVCHLAGFSNQETEEINEIWRARYGYEHGGISKKTRSGVTSNARTGIGLAGSSAAD